MSDIVIYDHVRVRRIKVIHCTSEISIKSCCSCCSAVLHNMLQKVLLKNKVTYFCSRDNCTTFWLSFVRCKFWKSGRKLMQPSQLMPNCTDLKAAAGSSSWTSIAPIDKCLHAVISFWGELWKTRRRFRFRFWHISSSKSNSHSLESRYPSSGFQIYCDMWRANNIVGLMLSLPFKTLHFVTLCVICNFLCVLNGCLTVSSVKHVTFGEK